MKKEISKAENTRLLMCSLGRHWNLRRISRKGELWHVEEWHGLSSNGMEFRAAACHFYGCLSNESITDEILVLFVNNRAPTNLDVSKVDVAGYTTRFDRHVDSLEYIGSGSSVATELGMSFGHDPENDSVGMDEWLTALEELPAIARRIKQSVYMLFAGNDVCAKTVDEHLSLLTNEECLVGEYASLADIAKATEIKLEPYEVKLHALGLSNQTISQLQVHMASISDSDVRGAVQKSMLAVPWRKRAQVECDISVIQQSLDEQLFGMEEAKQEVVEAIAGSLISNSRSFRPPAILLHGKPGTGKTAMAKAIAQALAVPFQSLSMNGVSTAMSIVGLEPFWRSPQPGEIIQSMIEAGVMNPLLLLDEIEKCGNSNEHGSPLNALLQVLDQSQNRTFSDLYLGVPVDVSEIFFIATANDISDIPEPLLDRFIVVEVPEYTVQEKLAIMPFLLAQIAEEHELSQVPHFSAAVISELETGLLPHAGLRQIKTSLWRILCKEAIHCDDLKQFRARPEIRTLRDNLLVKRKERAGIGFL